jgi:hypothetical protein
MSPGTQLPPVRSTARRKADLLAKLESEIDIWVTSAGATGKAHLIPLSFYWDGQRLTLATRRQSVTVRNLIRAGWARMALGPTRDVVILEGPVEVIPIEEDDDLADAYADGAGWDPRNSPGSYVLITVSPSRIQAWREVNENIEGKDVMLDGKWLA